MRNILAAQQKGKKPPAAVPEELQLPDKLAMPGPNPPNNVRIDSPPVVVDQPKDEPVNLWPWAIGTAGAALLCGGGAFILHQQVKEREQAHAEANTGAGKQTAADAAERNALLRDIVIVTGGVAAAAALTLTGIELFSGDTTAGVAPTPGGAAVMLGGTF